MFHAYKTTFKINPRMKMPPYRWFGCACQTMRKLVAKRLFPPNSITLGYF